MNSQERTKQYRERAHRYIPAGAHTYSRADNQFPASAPAFVSKAKDCFFEDENGKRFIDYSMGLLSVSIGHANEEINQQVIEAITRGNSYARPSLLEGEFAEKLSSLIPSAEMLKFAKNGSDVTSAAVRLARNYTKRKYVVRCRQQPFLSFNDWFIASTSRAGGIPEELGEWVLPFDYNNIQSLEQLFDAYTNKIACVIMEPFTNELPEGNFLAQVKSVCEKNGALLIFDEMITGFRVDIGGAQRLYQVTPHLSTFGKGIANGYPLAVLCGKKEIMQQGNMGGEVFLLSCTYGGETIGLRAGMATVSFMEKYHAPGRMASSGAFLMDAFNGLIKQQQLDPYIKVGGHPARPEIRFTENGATSFRLKTLFMQEMIRHGIFMERIGISYAHTDEVMQQTREALAVALPLLSSAIKENRINEKINGAVAEPVFTR